jgi:predicted lipoprotein with Yx(FWY)xxD motif
MSRSRSSVTPGGYDIAEHFKNTSADVYAAGPGRWTLWQWLDAANTATEPAAELWKRRSIAERRKGGRVMRGISWKSFAAFVSATIVVLAGVWLPSTTLGNSRQQSVTAVVKTMFNKKLRRGILVTSRGRTLYLWSDDPKGKPTCYDDATYHCAKAWIPLRTMDTPIAGRRVKASLLSTVVRSDGAPQVMYNGHPLYTDAGSSILGLKADKKPGDINGEGIYGWYVISPTGKPIK